MTLPFGIDISKYQNPDLINYAEASGIVPCDANGNVYFYMPAGQTMNVAIYVWGYWY